MLPTCIRLIHALVDVISSLGYLRPLIFCMQLSQMVVQGMWVYESPLLQIVDKQTAKILSDQYDVKDVSGFTEMEDEDRNKVL